MNDREHSARVCERIQLDRKSAIHWTPWVFESPMSAKLCNSTWKVQHRRIESLQISYVSKNITMPDRCMRGDH